MRPAEEPLEVNEISSPPAPPPACVVRPSAGKNIKEAEGLVTMTMAAEQQLFEFVTREELLTMGYMKLKKWLVTMGCEPKKVSMCMSHTQALDLAEAHGFLDLPKPGKEPTEYFGTFDSILDHRLDKNAFFSRRVDMRHESNKMESPKQFPVKNIEPWNPGFRHTGDLAYL
eukprot:TRINITY_DN18354_c0_g1_i1.p1 TRINITY_DN18354_c0_g1~~TRINITY_DN18354_c0_g1_i1.p1  ORF type:complete len:171 (-),score=34.97 TRINITY_DN18354_c0_g1_i1:144-656(-)